jgi:type IV secretion system protein VirB8
MFKSKQKLEPTMELPAPANLVRHDESKQFYKDARSWELDRGLRAERSDKRAWRIIWILSFITLASMAAHIARDMRPVAPPPIIAIDKTTGNSEVINAGDDVSKNYSELLAMFFCNQYVIARESYQYTSLQTDYDRVLAWSSDDAGRMYSKVFEGDNARDKRLGPNTEERIRIISVVPPSDSTNKMVVRYEKSTRRNGADVAEPPQPYVVTMAFEFKPSARGIARDLIANPIGFQVTSYRSDSELVPTASK